MLSVALKISLRVDFHCRVIFKCVNKCMEDSARKRNSPSDFSTLSAALHALLVIHLRAILRAYTHLKNYATEEIHLSVGSTVFGLKI